MPPRRWAPLALALLLTGCSGPERWNLLLVTLDTTRADHLGAWGYGHVETPALDALARGGVRWARCYSPVPLTLPAHASLLTGLLPARHGLHANGRGALAEEALTLAETLAARGWATGAVVGAFVLDRRFGLAQGFEHYDDDLSGGSEPSRFSFLERDAARVTDAALAWLDEGARDPWLLWVHYFDPHAPYAAPGFDPALAVRMPYDAEIEFVDAQLGRLLDSLDASGAAGRTLVVVAADHGEALFEHGEPTHGLFAYDSTLHVPLIARFPDARRAGTVVAPPVSLVDLLPSLLGWLGLGPPGGLDGRPLPLEDPDADGRVIYFENQGPQYLFGWSPLRGILADGHKLIWAPRPELYALASDPDERDDVYGVDAERARAWRERFERAWAELEARPRLEPTATDMDETSRRRLAALGYVDVGVPVAGGADPKDMVDVHLLLQLAMSQIDAGRTSEGIATLREILDGDDPTNMRAIAILAELLLEPALRAAALEALAPAARRGSGSPALDAGVRGRVGLALARDGRDAVVVAVDRLVATGFAADLFDNVAVAIADLPDAALGWATGTSIVIDVNAAGYGWYVDKSPLDDSEFALPGGRSQIAAGRIDLLTAVMHELGHVAGLEDISDPNVEDNLMYGLLEPGVRKTSLEASLADEAFAEF